MYKDFRLVIKSADERQQIISDINQGTGDSCKAKAKASHPERDTTYQKRPEIFFWHNMLEDISEFVK